jgi:hypothetical protein
MFLVTRRATVLVPSGTAEQPDLKHLFILLNDPVNKEKLVLMVSISTIRPGRFHDTSCLLGVGDHPFIRCDSFVLYAKARIESVKTLEEGVRQQLLLPKDPMDGSVFARICEGLLISRHTPAEIKRFFEPIWRP